LNKTVSPEGTGSGGISGTILATTPGGVITVADATVVLIKEKTVVVFDTGEGTYPSISGMHEGTITPSKDIPVHKMYTYPCAGTGGAYQIRKDLECHMGWRRSSLERLHWRLAQCHFQRAFHTKVRSDLQLHH
jgi:hypothetical protein